MLRLLLYFSGSTHRLTTCAGKTDAGGKTVLTSLRSFLAVPVLTAQLSSVVIARLYTYRQSRDRLACACALECLRRNNSRYDLGLNRRGHTA